MIFNDGSFFSTDIMNSEKTKRKVKSVVEMTNHKVILRSKFVPENVVDECKNESTLNMNDEILLDANVLSDNNIQDDTVIHPLDKDLILFEDIIIVKNHSDENILSQSNEVSFDTLVEERHDDLNNSSIKVLQEQVIFNNNLQESHDDLTDNSYVKVLQEELIKQQNFPAVTVTSNICETNKENIITMDSEKINNANENKSILNITFDECFTKMPIEYLPKKKRATLEAAGKSKEPCAGHMDIFWENQMRKLGDKKIKEEKIAKKKLLQEKKKKLAEEKKLLHAQMMEINKQIKSEKT